MAETQLTVNDPLLNGSGSGDPQQVLKELIENYVRKRDAERILQLEMEKRSCPMIDIIAHIFLPKVTPDCLQENLGVVEDNLLDMTLTTISGVMEDYGILGLDCVKVMFHKWIEIQPNESQGSCLSFIENFRRALSQVREGQSQLNTLPLYVKKQNATILIRKENKKFQISTFRCSLPSKVIMSNVNSLTLDFPETCEVFQNVDLLSSETFLSQLYQLTQEDFAISMATKQKLDQDPLKDNRDVAESFLVTDWIVGCLAPSPYKNASDKYKTGISKKKIRDQINLKVSTDSSLNIPFRRSGMWLSIKVALHLSLLHVFSKEIATFTYKIILLRLLTDTCKNYRMKVGDSATRVNLDLVSQMTSKVARRVMKLQKLYQQLTYDLVDEKHFLSRWMSRCMEHTKSVVTKISQEMKHVWSKMIEETSEELENRPSQISRTIAEFYHEDLNHPIAWLDKLIDFFTKIENGHNRKDSSSVIKKGNRSPEQFQRYSNISEILQGAQNISHDLNILRESPLEALKTQIWLHDTEKFIKSQLHFQSKFSPNLLLELSATYMKIARRFYGNDPVGTSQIYLIVLKIHQELDKLTTKQFPMLREYPPEVDREAFDKLLLAHSADINLLDEILSYFESREKLANPKFPGILSTDKIKDENSFCVRFARQNQKMLGLKAEILRETENQVKDKFGEVQSKKEACDEIQRQIDAHSCKCKYEKKKVRNERGRFTTERILIETCDQCDLKSDLNDAKRSLWVYERPLPPKENWRDAIAFEMCLPQEISNWRESLAVLKWELMGEDEFDSSIFLRIPEYKKLAPYYKSTTPMRKIINLGSKCTTNFLDYLRFRANPDLMTEPKESFVIENGIQCLYEYQRQSGWPSAIGDMTVACSFRLKSTPYESLQKYLESTDHTQNQVLASQVDCHNGISLEEFVTFGSVRAGHRIQMWNLYRAISGRLISLSEEPVLALILQTLWQVERREAHLDYQEKNFSMEFLKLLDTLVEENQANFSKPLILLMAIVITTRILDMNPYFECTEKCDELLRLWRSKVISEWISKIENLKNGNDESLKRKLMMSWICIVLYCKGWANARY